MANNLLDQVLNNANFPLWTVFAVFVSVVTIIITTLIYRYLTGKTQRNSALLVGLSQSGKTLLYTQLTANRFVSSVTSMKQNESLLNLANGKAIQLIDLPGFERLREMFWDDFKLRAKAVIFVIDSCDFMNNIRDVTELLYNYLVDDTLATSRIPVLVACNKQDETKSKSAKVIQNQLEREINAIRETRIGALSSTGDENTRAILGKIDREFSFSDLKTPIEFAECCAAENEPQLQSVLNWLQKVA